jgi:integrase
VKLLDLPGRGFVCRWFDPIDGRLRQQSMAPLGITNRVQAELWAKQRSENLLATRAQVAAGGSLAVRTSLEEAKRNYLAGFKEGTAKGKRTVLVALCDFLANNGIHDVCDLPAPLLARWRDNLSKGQPRKLAQTTVNRWLEAAAAFARWAVEQGYAPTLTDDAIKRSLKRVKVARDAIEFMRPSDLRRLLDAALRHDAAPRDPLARGPRPPVAPLILLDLLTGLRQAELLQLQWSDWDQKGECIRLPAKRAKGQFARTIDLSMTPTATRLLQALALRRSGARVLHQWSTTSLSSWESSRKRLFKLGAPEFTLHTLRRTCGTVLACAPGVPITVWAIAQRQGHNVQVAEKHYVGALSGLPKDAATLEAAADIEDIANRIIGAAGGLVPAGDEQAVAQ